MQKSGSTRESILRVATKLFARQGYDGTSTNQICKLAKANVAAVTYHFGTKEKLYEEVLSSLFSGNNPKERKKLVDATSVHDLKVKLCQLADNMIALFLSSPEISHIIFRDAALHKASGKVLTQGLKASQKELATFLKKAQQAGFIRKDMDADIAASSFAHLVVTPARNPFLMDTLPKLDVRIPRVRKKFLNETLGVFFKGIL